MDDDTGWNRVLVEGWTFAVRDAVVARVEQATVAWRGPLVRVLAEMPGADERWTEQLHHAVISAIGQETGADLDALGSQAAWACYEQVWDELGRRWSDGGRLPVVPLGAEPEVTAVLATLPPAVAAAGGADVRGPVPDPLWLRGRLRVDVEGLDLQLRSGQLSDADRLRVQTVLAHLR